VSTAVESDPVASDRAAALQAAVVPPQSDTRSFRREMTPTWLSAAVLLGGQRPPHLERSFHVLYLGSASGVTPAVIAAVHPDATVWVWDWRPSSIESTRRLRDAAGLSNLVVNEHPVLAPQLDGAVADVIAVEGVLDSAPDDIRDSVINAVSTSLRPGGVACISYKTAVGWAEIAPVQRLIKYVASRAGGDPIEHIPEALDLLRTLEAGGARYLTERPIVAAWLRELHAMDPATIVAQYVERDLRPLSHAQVARDFAAIGCYFAGSALITDDLGRDVPDALAPMIAATPQRTLRETYSDVAVRRATRADIFRLGAARLTTTELGDALGQLELTAVSSNLELARDVDADVPAKLVAGAVSAAELDRDPLRGSATVRTVMDSGFAHPLAAAGAPPDALARARALNAALVHGEGSTGDGVAAAPTVGTAIPRRERSQALIDRLGAA
jgi:hypothetical protein